MVEQMVSSNLSKYGLGNSASIVTTANTTTSEVRDMQNDNKPPSSVEDDQAKNPTPGPTSGNVNRNLVYARRKSDAELSNSDKNRTTLPAYQQQATGDQNKTNESPALNSIATATRIKNFESDQASSTMEHWNARFTQLHNYLRQCDTSSQEVYLRSEFFFAFYFVA